MVRFANMISPSASQAMLGDKLCLDNSISNTRLVKLSCFGYETIGLERTDISYRWKTETATVLSAELADALVADFIGGGCGVQTIHQHALPRGLKPKHLLVLQRTHGSQRAELVMKRGHAHAGCLGQFVHTQRLCEIGT